MDKVISYNEFLKHKNNLDAYLKELFDKVPGLKLYFPISLTSEERYLIYTKSKGYLFEKLHKVGSKYSIKLWKPIEQEEYVEQKEYEEKEEYEEEYEDDFKEQLSEISNVLEKQYDIIFREVQKCRRAVNRMECIFTLIVAVNLVDSILYFKQLFDGMSPSPQLPELNMITDF